MRDLARFREAVEQYRKQVGRTEEELARELYISKGELNKRLHDYYHPQSRRTWRLKPEHVFKIVETLAKWGAITAGKQALMLFNLVDYPYMQEVNWQSEHWRKLHTDSSLFNSLPPFPQEEKLAQLHAMLIDHTGFLHTRLESFVGREHELAEIRHNISTMLPIGGYITITGQAGQGKSSIIAKLVEEYGQEETAHHFIPFNPGPDYQVSLLRDLMARLILKHALPDWYLANESRPSLRDYFPKMLAEIEAKGKQEVIFIDGLDQLMGEQNGERDLSFLPNTPPRGVVFVLGTRPNDILYPLELRKSHCKYDLPNMSRQNFDLILEHRGVKLNVRLADQFYQAMQGNALYLDLVAKELVQEGVVKPEEIIARTSDNPENLFSLSIARLKKIPSEWREVLKPILLISAEGSKL